MRKLLKTISAFLIIVGTLFQSCETLDLEEIDNPNALTEGDAQFLLNNIQLLYRASMAIASDRSSELTRIDYMFGRNYFANYNSATMNALWGNLYSGVLPDIQAIEAVQSESNDLRFHISVAKILQAHMMMQLVDFIGDIVPLEQATNPTEIPIPELTSDAGLTGYNQALALLNEAVNMLQQDPPITGVQDLYYDGDAMAWIRLANTLKLRAAITTSNYSEFNTIISGGNFISETSQDLEFNYGTQLAPVNTQHPDYAADYTSSGAAIYQNTWLMQNMIESNDPRIRYYFYRQVNCTPGASCDPEGNFETLRCSQLAVPAHLQGTPCEEMWCHLENGYWGRQHGNDNGTPPDNFTRTAVGVFPAGGNFDDDRFIGVNLGQSSNGAGIEPILRASTVDFWRAEAALVAGNTSMAAMHLQNGMIKSIAKVQSSISLDPLADISFAPDSDAVNAFISEQMEAFNDASGEDQWNILAEQFWVALYGGDGTTAHNFYRRTGYPSTVCPNIDPNPGNYIRTFLYPQNEVVANPSIIQRENNDDAVFWNNQPLPTAN